MNTSNPRLYGDLAQADTDRWSFGRPDPWIVFASGEQQDASEAPNQNTDKGSTTESPDGDFATESSVTEISGPFDFGKRSMHPVSHWEGVVEEVNGESFSCRIILPGDQFDPRRMEVIEFFFDELAHSDDRPLVVQGAELYWTVAKATNYAGTLTNSSLVRLRRIPFISNRRLRDSGQKADVILEKLGLPDGTDSANR